MACAWLRGALDRFTSNTAPRLFPVGSAVGSGLTLDNDGMGRHRQQAGPRTFGMGLSPLEEH